MKRDYRCYPVRIDQDGNVWTLDGASIGGPEMAKAIKDGFAAATPEAFGGGHEERAAKIASVRDRKAV